eukprot:682906_1
MENFRAILVCGIIVGILLSVVVSASEEKNYDQPPPAKKRKFIHYVEKSSGSNFRNQLNSGLHVSATSNTNAFRDNHNNRFHNDVDTNNAHTLGQPSPYSHQYQVVPGQPNSYNIQPTLAHNTFNSNNPNYISANTAPVQPRYNHSGHHRSPYSHHSNSHYQTTQRHPNLYNTQTPFAHNTFDSNNQNRMATNVQYQTAPGHMNSYKRRATNVQYQTAPGRKHEFVQAQSHHQRAIPDSSRTQEFVQAQSHQRALPDSFRTHEFVQAQSHERALPDSSRTHEFAHAQRYQSRIPDSSRKYTSESCQPDQSPTSFCNMSKTTGMYSLRK